MVLSNPLPLVYANGAIGNSKSVRIPLAFHRSVRNKGHQTVHSFDSDPLKNPSQPVFLRR